MKRMMLAIGLYLGTSAIGFGFEAGGGLFKGAGHLKNGDEQKEYKVTVQFDRSEENQDITMTETYIFGEDHQKQLLFTLKKAEREGCFTVHKEGSDAVGKGCCVVRPERGIKECHMGVRTDEMSARRRMVFNKKDHTLTRSGVIHKGETVIHWRDRLKAVPGDE